MHASPIPASLIVNADDYGYFRSVSRGILEAAKHGIVTATGVFANAEGLAGDVPGLLECAALDVGVHLNLTEGRPLSPDMRESVARWGGRFPGKFTMMKAILTGAVGLERVAIEWRTQIEQCMAMGLVVRFLNSHEHIHMLPALFRLVRDLADEFRIPHVRFTAGRLARGMSSGARVRGAIIMALASINRRRAKGRFAEFRGLEASGRLNMRALDASTSDLRPGRVYELMCHPGRLDRSEVADPRLLAYHDWEGELATLTDPRARALLEERGIRLIGYRHLAPGDGPPSALPTEPPPV